MPAPPCPRCATTRPFSSRKLSSRRVTSPNRRPRPSRSRRCSRPPRWPPAPLSWARAPGSRSMSRARRWPCWPARLRVLCRFRKPPWSAPTRWNRPVRRRRQRSFIRSSTTVTRVRPKRWMPRWRSIACAPLSAPATLKRPWGCVLNARTGSATPANWLRRARSTPPLPPISGAPAANWRKCAPPLRPIMPATRVRRCRSSKRWARRQARLRPSASTPSPSVSAGWIAATVWTPLWPHYPPPRPVRCGVCARWPALPTCSSSWTTRANSPFSAPVPNRFPMPPRRRCAIGAPSGGPIAIATPPPPSCCGSTCSFIQPRRKREPRCSTWLGWRKSPEMARQPWPGTASSPAATRTITTRSSRGPFCSGWSRSVFSLPRQWRRFSPASHSPSGRDRPTSIPTQPPPAASNARGCSTRPASTPGPKANSALPSGRTLSPGPWLSN